MFDAALSLWRSYRRPVGMEFAADGAADRRRRQRGLLRVAPGGEVTVLAVKAPTSLIAFARTIAGNRR